MFPLDIKLKTKIQISNLASNHRSEIILDFFANEFKERKADNLLIEENVLRFRNKFFKLINSWNIMVPVDKGELRIQEEMNTIVFHYQFSLRRTLLLGAIAGIFFYLFSEEWLSGLYAFLWLGGMNWLIAVMRHYFMFTDLIKKLTKR
jgi:hypothetical protein